MMYNLTYIFVPILDPRCYHGFVAVSNYDWFHGPHWHFSSEHAGKLINLKASKLIKKPGLIHWVQFSDLTN